jgi:hypothetical protein
MARSGTSVDPLLNLILVPPGLCAAVLGGGMLRLNADPAIWPVFALLLASGIALLGSISANLLRWRGARVRANRHPAPRPAPR